VQFDKILRACFIFSLSNPLLYVSIYIGTVLGLTLLVLFDF
jgi:hypothetical protein